MIKAVFFDIDGTLRDFDTGRIPESVREAVAQARREGILCFAATGRHLLEIEEESLLEGVSLDGLVTLNGQYCLDGKGRVLYENPIPKDQVRQMLDFLEEKPLPCIFMEAEAMYINFVDDRVRQAQAGIGTAIPPIRDLQRGLGHPVYQMVPYGDACECEQILHRLPGCRGLRWHDGLAIDIISADGSKENGIRRILSRFGISREECAAVGDGYNDLSMIRWAGLGIAMGNGKPEVREAADYVTAAVTEDGIRQAMDYIRRFRSTRHPDG